MSNSDQLARLGIYQDNFGPFDVNFGKQESSKKGTTSPNWLMQWWIAIWIAISIICSFLFWFLLFLTDNDIPGNTLNPEYGETFSFHNVPSLEKLALHVKVMDDDIGKDDKIGGCTVKVYELEGIESGDFIEIEKKIDAKLFRADAKIHLKIKWEE